jgi:SAM-dependent methyltransferase
MPNYRPLTDFWILARAKLKDGKRWYGAYPGGYLERARALLGVTIDDPVLHLFGGCARYYPYKNGFGPNDKTLDLDPVTEPDYQQDGRDPLPLTPNGELWSAVLCDPPYTEADADHYMPGRKAFPAPNKILKNALEVVRPGGRVGMLHYVWPSPPKGVRCVAAVGVVVGYNNRIRIYSVYERLTE